jgi:hypothetical protein
MYTGSCLCGGIRFEIDGELPPIQVCHCTQCRKAQGAPLATNVPVPSERFRLLDGQELLRGFESSPGKQRMFCSRCGSPILSRRNDLPGVVRLRMGTIDGHVNARPAAHYWVAAKANWWNITDDLPQFAGGRQPVAADGEER